MSTELWSAELTVITLHLQYWNAAICLLALSLTRDMALVTELLVQCMLAIAFSVLKWGVKECIACAT